MVVGFLKQDRADDSETAPYKWQINEIGCEHINDSQVFEVTSEVPF